MKKGPTVHSGDVERMRRFIALSAALAQNALALAADGDRLRSLDSLHTSMRALTRARNVLIKSLEGKTLS